MKSTKNNHYSQRLKEVQGNIRSTWNVIKESIGKRKSTLKLNSINIDGTCLNLHRDGKAVANAFNQFFSTIGADLVKDLGGAAEPPINMNADGSFWDVSQETISKIIDGLKGGSSPGFDGLTVFTIKSIKNLILKPLTYLINLSFKTGIFPSIYKIAHVIPLFKSGDPKLLNNYRPISLLSNISKIIEKTAKLYLVSFLEENGLLHNNQFGFRGGKSTQDAIVYLIKKKK